MRTSRTRFGPCAAGYQIEPAATRDNDVEAVSRVVARLDNKDSYLPRNGVESWKKTLPQLPRHRRPSHRRTSAPTRLQITCSRPAAMPVKRRDALASSRAPATESGKPLAQSYPWMHRFGAAVSNTRSSEAESAHRKSTGQRHRRLSRHQAYSFSENLVHYRRGAHGVPVRRQNPPHVHRPLSPVVFRRTLARIRRARRPPQPVRESSRGFRRYGPTFTHRHRLNRRNPRHDCPLVKLPSQDVLLQLWQRSPRITKIYLQAACRPADCRHRAPNRLAPLDFGSEDDPDRNYSHGMNVRASAKTELLRDCGAR